MSVVFFDFETGGVTEGHPNIQLGAIAIGPEWNELETFERKIKFDEKDADPEALKMNHYDPEVWAREAVDEWNAMRDFSGVLKRHASLDMISKRTGAPYSVARLAGHNAATFDGPRLQAAFKRWGLFLPAHPLVMCTLQRAMWFCQESGVSMPSLKLTAVAEYFGVALPDAHDALADVRGSIVIAKAMSLAKIGVAA